MTPESGSGSLDGNYIEQELVVCTKLKNESFTSNMSVSLRKIKVFAKNECFSPMESIF